MDAPFIVETVTRNRGRVTTRGFWWREMAEREARRLAKRSDYYRRVEMRWSRAVPGGGSFGYVIYLGGECMHHASLDSGVTAGGFGPRLSPRGGVALREGPAHSAGESDRGGRAMALSNATAATGLLTKAIEAEKARIARMEFQIKNLRIAGAGEAVVDLYRIPLARSRAHLWAMQQEEGKV